MSVDERRSGGGRRRGARRCAGRLRVPGDKSISHRALLFAALADGRSTITDLATGADVAATRRSARAARRDGRRSRGDAIDASRRRASTGCASPTTSLDCGNSGTTMRVLAGVLAGRPFLSVLDGDASLRQRPMARVVEPLRAMGAHDRRRATTARSRRSSSAAARSRGVRHELAVASAQVKTRAAARRAAGRRARPRSWRPAPSRDHTERMLAALGAPVTTGRRRRGAGRAPARPMPFELDVPGDPSSAAFFVVAACDHARLRARARGRRAQPDAARVRRRAAAHGRRHRGRRSGEVRVGEPVGDIARASARRCTARRSRATRSRPCRTRSPRSRSRPRSPTASPRSATRPSCA